MMQYDFCVLREFRYPLRIDQFISDELGLISRNQLKQRVRELKINGKPVKLSRKIAPQDRVQLDLEAPRKIELVPEEIPLDILYEDARVIVINKPQGLVVHPAPGNYTGTLVHGLLHYREIEAPEEDFRPGIVHRLDKDTSGVLITARDQEAHEFLARQFQEKTTCKVYFALCRGRIEEAEGRVENRLGRSERNRQLFTAVSRGGKTALSNYRVLRRWKQASFVALYPATGRTHQLRVHMRGIGHPILGDPLYGSGEQDGCSLMLHAFSLEIMLPDSTMPSRFIAPLPPRFGKVIRSLSAETD
jgi:23S rRNA pseudouridine1911/1915/1917 synthase